MPVIHFDILSFKNEEALFFNLIFSQFEIRHVLKMRNFFQAVALLTCRDAFQFLFGVALINWMLALPAQILDPSNAMRGALTLPHLVWWIQNQ